MRPDFEPIEHYDVSSFRLDGLYLSNSEPFKLIPTNDFGLATSSGSYMAITIYCHMKVLDRENGLPREIKFGRTVPLSTWNNPKKRNRAVKATIQAAVFHEIRECLLVDGERIFDPVEEHEKAR